MLTEQTEKHLNFLVIRFRQMGDAVMATVVLDTLRQTFPQARIDFVLNERIAPLFAGHPAVSNIITFSDDERHGLRYVKKVWQTVRAVHYDGIIDMRSTPNTLLFPLFSLRSRWRMGLKKAYAHGVLNHMVSPCTDKELMTEHNLEMLRPLESIRPLRYSKCPSLYVTDEEKADFRTRMEEKGIDFGRPVLLAGVTAKLANKTWAADRMEETVRRIINRFPSVQVVFNFAPGIEEQQALQMSERLHAPQVFTTVEARSMRELAAMAANVTAYFGNEGGARHVVGAMGKPTFVICAPGVRKHVWIGEDTRAVGVEDADILPETTLSTMSQTERYGVITVEEVWKRLQPFLDECLGNGTAG